MTTSNKQKPTALRKAAYEYGEEKAPNFSTVFAEALAFDKAFEDGAKWTLLNHPDVLDLQKRLQLAEAKLKAKEINSTLRTYDGLAERYDALEQKLAKAVAALKFYANREMFIKKGSEYLGNKRGGDYGDYTDIGDEARSVLLELGESEVGEG